VGRRAKAGFALGAVAAATVATVLLLSHSDDAATVGVEGGTVSVGGVEVTIPAHALRRSSDIAIQEVDYDAADFFPDLAAISKTFSIDVDQRLARAAAVSMPVLDEPRPGARILVASREAPAQMWILTPGRYEPDDRAVSFRTREFTFFQVLEVVRSGAVDAGVTATKAFLEFGDVRTEEPECGEAPVGWTLEGDTGIGDANAVLYACLEADGEEAAVRIVNDRGIGLSTSLPAGFRTVAVGNPNVPDRIATALRSAAGSHSQTIPAAGEVRVVGPAARAEFAIHPTFGSFAFDAALFAVGELGGRAGKSVEGAAAFLECANGVIGTSAKADDQLKSVQAGAAFAVNMWRRCGSALARSGAGATAEAGAVFFGGVKLGAASADSLGSLINHERFELRIRPAPVGPGTTCGVVKSGRTWNPYGDYARPLDVEVEVGRGAVLCSEAMATLSWYARIDPESACVDSGNSCALHRGSWTCYTPPPPSFPTLIQCEDGPNEVRGVDTEPLPTTGSIQPCAYRSPPQAGGPYNVETNLRSCNQAWSIAERATSGFGSDQLDFTCEGRITGLESSHTVCRSGNAVVTYDEGA